MSYQAGKGYGKIFLRSWEHCRLWKRAPYLRKNRNNLPERISVMENSKRIRCSNFYDFLRPENKGKKVYVCNGSSCLTAGTQDRLIEKLHTSFKEEEIGEMCCLGRCHENSSFFYEGHNYSGKDIDNIGAIKKGIPQPIDKYNVAHYGTPVLTCDFPGIDTFYKTLDKALKLSPDNLLAELKTSGASRARGRGFPHRV